MTHQGQLHKMRTTWESPIRYVLDLDGAVDMNDLLGQKIQLKWLGQITCISCGKNTKTSFNQGFCYTCFVASPASAECILRPELCRAHLGEGRDPEWEESHHNQPHVVYLAASHGLKVGVTRSTQVPTRWIDQGASSVIVVADLPNRYLAGVLEVELKNQFSDKTNWQRMLKNELDESIDLVEEKWALEEILPEDLLAHFSEDDQIYAFEYPVLAFPAKVKSLSFDKDPLVSGILKGIKGQYLIFEGGLVINLRKFTGYQIELTF